MPEEKPVQRAGREWREKVWYDIIAPPTFGSAKIGETPAADPRLLIGRTFETTLGDLTEDFSKSHIKLHFQVERVDGNRAFTKFIMSDMAHEYVRSQVRRRATKVGGILTVATQDGYKLQLTSMVITLRRIKGSQIRAIRAEMERVISDSARGRTFDQFVQEMVLGKLSADIYKVVKRYCPIKRVEVVKVEVLGAPS